MDQTLWRRILPLIKQEARRLGRLPKATFPDWLIVAMEVWRTEENKPMCWACDRQHYPGFFRPKRLPSISQFTRRIKTPRCRRILEALHRRTSASASPTAISYFDGKPLIVGAASRDPEALRGHIMGGFAKGYKLHAWVTQDRRIPVFSVQSLNRGEPLVAQAMAESLPMMSGRAMVLADSNYDSTELYKALARKNAALLVRPRGFAKHPTTLRQAGPFRRAMLGVWQEMPGWAKMVYRQRIHVEGTFSNLTCPAHGLGPLPAWVRRLPRVTRWVGIKIILYHVRLMAQRGVKKLCLMQNRMQRAVAIP
jgi:Transposase DDE domain